MNIKASDAQAFRQEGAQAFALGEPIYQCPYEHRGERCSFYRLSPAREWRKGWIAAKDEFISSHGDARVH